MYRRSDRATCAAEPAAINYASPGDTRPEGLRVRASNRAQIWAKRGSMSLAIICTPLFR